LQDRFQHTNYIYFCTIASSGATLADAANLLTQSDFKLAGPIYAQCTMTLRVSK